MSFFAARKPVFEPPPNPRFVGSSIREHQGKRCFIEFGASIGGGVVDNDDLIAGMKRHGLDHRRQILLQQITAVPVRNDDRGGSRDWAS